MNIRERSLSFKLFILLEAKIEVVILLILLFISYIILKIYIIFKHVFTKILIKMLGIIDDYFLVFMNKI